MKLWKLCATLLLWPGLGLCAQGPWVITPQAAATGRIEQPHEGGELVLHFELRCAEANWEREGAESVVLALCIDGVPHHDVVVTGKARLYRQRVGPLGRGAHDWSLRWRAEVSPVQQGSVHAQLRHSAATPASGLLAHAPILLGRVDADTSARTPLMAHSDTPLLLLARALHEGGAERYEYHAVFSNEDGGTGRFPSMMMLRYGRTSDVERVCISTAEHSDYQSANHGTARFKGVREGAHPLLRVATDNNNFSDELGNVREGLRFSMDPVLWPESGPRERVLEREPWITFLANAEMLRERGTLAGILSRAKCEVPGDPRSVALSDVSNYVLVEVDLDCAATTTWRVGARCGKEWWWSDHERVTDRHKGGGWTRTGIELPPGAQAEELALDFPDTPTGVLQLRSFQAWRFRDSAQHVPLLQPIQHAVELKAPRTKWKLSR